MTDSPRPPARPDSAPTEARQDGPSVQLQAAAARAQHALLESRLALEHELDALRKKACRRASGASRLAVQLKS